jgi:mono/diheme cytochrome c family protein
MNATEKTGFSRNGNSAGRGVALIGILVAGILAAYAGGVATSARAAASAKSTNDGVYTADQAKRGKALYSQSCSNCHMDDLSGSGQAPPLAGDVFLQTWDGRSVADLFDNVRTTMPLNQPDSLSAQEYIDLVTFMLQANDFPAGKDELKNDPETLKGIIITKKSNP